MINYLYFFRLNLNRALITVEMTFLKCDKKERRRRLKVMLMSMPYLSFPLKKLNNSPKPAYYFLKSMGRADYDMLFYKIIDCCQLQKVSYDITESLSGFSIVQLINIFICIPFIFRVYRKNIIHWIFMYLNLVKIYSQTRMLTSIKDAHLVVFADMQPLDNLAVQYASMIKNDTTTLQHGLYVDYENLVNVNAANYLNADAVNFLAWGEDTATLIRKYHPKKKIFLCGKPTLSIPADMTEGKYFTVVFDQNIFFNFNIELLIIAYQLSNSLGLKVNLRLHPNNRLKWFKLEPENTLIDQSIWSSRFILGHTSSLIYECMRVGIPAFRYATSAPALTTPASIEFKDFSQLLNLIKKIPFSPTEEMAHWYISEIGEQSIFEYLKYFNGQKSPLAET